MLAHLVESLQTLQKQTPLFDHIQRGIERETLRTTSQSTLAPTPHSAKLGSKLTHPSITTDYSENLLELITAPHHKIESLLKELTDLHAYAAQSLPDERLWAMSMPCILGDDDSIRIADYGTSNNAQMKMHYRRGLSHRYGRHMQCIAGLHYNFSFPMTFWETWYAQFDPCHHTLQDCINANYMRLIRNYLKHAWLIFMVMGASPACDQSFFMKTPPDFLSLHPPRTLFAPQACSLRMSRVGYQSEVQDHIRLSYNSLDQYLLDLEYATATSSPHYQRITQEFGKGAQLNANLLQIEAELYAPIRPKQVPRPCERPIRALKTRGIEYIEVRGIDVNPLSPIGITSSQVHFLDTFLMFCLLHNSPTFSLDNAMQWHSNQTIAVFQGLSPDCTLASGDRPILATPWADELFDDLLLVASLFDHNNPDKPHDRAVRETRSAFDLRKTLPASLQLDALNQGAGFIEYGQSLSQAHHNTLMSHVLSSDTQKKYEDLAQSSLLAQEKMERDQNISYEEYLKRYYQ